MYSTNSTYPGQRATTMATKNHYNNVNHSEEDDNYSEDFVVDEEHNQPAKPKQFPTTRTRGYGKGKSHGRGGRRVGGGNQSRAASDSGKDVVTKRLLSASHQKIKDLQNEVEDLRRQMKIIIEENKLYKRLQHKQEKALEKFEDRENELPQLIQAHNNEVRTIKEQLRRTREKYEKTDRYLRDAEDELEKAKARMKKYKDLADQQELAERSELRNNLNDAELKIEEKDVKIKELERYIENLKKNHRHELGIERARSKETQHQLENAQAFNKKLEEQVKEKEKVLELRNIYSNRLLHPSSYSGTPQDSPPLWKQALKKRAPSLTDVTPREKAKAYEEKRKVEEKKKKVKNVKMHKWEDSAIKKGTEIKESQASFNSLPHQDSEDDFWKRQEEEYKQQRDQESGEKEREREEAKRKNEEKEREQFLRNREKMKRDLEDREKAERIRREEDAKERREHERARMEQEEREERERERREHEQERERRARADKEKRAKEERERLDNDPRLAEERRKKDELLRRLKQLDASKENSQPQDPFAPVHTDKATTVHGGGDTAVNTLFATSSSSSLGKKQQRDPFLNTMADNSEYNLNNKKDYAFTRPIENLHKGRPSHGDVSVPYLEKQRRSKAEKEDLETGGYQPSYSTTKSGKMHKKPMSLFEDDSSSKASSTPVDKKSKLMADLFGPEAAATHSKRNDSDDMFLTSKLPLQPTHSKQSSGFPWDDDKSSSKAIGSTAVNHRESSVLFGGGAALVDDDSAANNSSAVLLPRRQRQQSTAFSSKPAVTAIDNIDDDIEEVIL